MVTPTGRDAGYDAQVRVDGGSFGLVREHAALAQAINDGNAEAARAAALRHMEQSALRLQAADKAFWASA
ncbi:FCD domain-containing protein, partial [Salmonella enterica]|uniref:FCD domain-containing protein n=1 Tax=Salmonella enterica TaxID=28901 RepID=UPI003CED1D64